MREEITRIWEGDEAAQNSFLTLLLGLLSGPYRLLISFRNILFDRGILRATKLSCPVISVGNITVGGTGKTPLVISLARYFQQQGFSPAVLTRGYGGKRQSGVILVSNGKDILSNHETVGEEAILLARRLPGVPVLVAKKRALAGQAARKMFQSDLLILDDAFQHRSLFRDIDIVLLDYLRPFGNGWLLPRGTLRESREGLKRADVIVYTGRDDSAVRNYDLEKILIPSNVKAPRFIACHKPTELFHPASGQSWPPETLRGKKVCLFSGIGSPAGFKNTVESLGALVTAYRIFPDHHNYRQEDLARMHSLFLEKKADFLVTTEKDSVKLADFPDNFHHCHVLRVELEIISDEIVISSNSPNDLPSRERELMIFYKVVTPDEPVK